MSSTSNLNNYQHFLKLSSIKLKYIVIPGKSHRFKFILFTYILFTGLFAVCLFLYGFFPIKHHENPTATKQSIPKTINNIK